MASPDCTNRMNSELPRDFAKMVAHVSHSLTKQDILYFFPTDKKDINMPVINFDLSSRAAILSEPLEVGHTFASPALRAVDQILAEMNSPYFGTRKLSDLEIIISSYWK